MSEQVKESPAPTELHQPLPVHGYTAQDTDTVKLVNKIKVHEERILQAIDALHRDTSVDLRWLAIARTDLQKGYMALVRSIFNPGRFNIPDDADEF